MKKTLRRVFLLAIVLATYTVYKDGQRENNIQELDPIILVATPTPLPILPTSTPTLIPYDLSQFLTPESQCGITMSCIDPNTQAGVCGVNMSCPDDKPQSLEDLTRSLWSKFKDKIK